MLPRLPPEVTDRIIDHLWDDISALHSACLTARSWVACSRYHLFSTLRVANRRAYDCLVHLVQHAPHMLPLFSLVQELQIYDAPMKKRPYAHVVPHIFATRLPALKTIRLYSADWRRVPLHKSFSMFLSLFTSVTQLELDACQFRSFDEFQRVVCAFPKLAHLFVRGEEVFALPPVQPHAVAAPVVRARVAHRPRLTSLGLWLRIDWHKEHTALWKWFLMTPSSYTLQSICINCPGTEWHAAFAKMLAAVGPSLLRLDTPLLSDLDEEGCTLLRNSNLRELVINPQNVQPWPQAWATFTNMMSQITSRDMTNLTFNTRVCGRDPQDPQMQQADTARDEKVWDDIEWDRLNAIIKGDAFSHLQKVVIRMQWDLWGLPFRETAEFLELRNGMATRMQRLHWHTLGILTVSHGIPVAEVYDFDFKQYTIND